MNVAQLIERLTQLPPDAELHASGHHDHGASVWVVVGGEEVGVLDTDEDAYWRGTGEA